MNISITGRRIEVTDAIKTHIEGGLDKIRGHFNQTIDADIVLTVEKHRHIAEINLHANGVHIHGKESSSDMYASVDKVVSKVDKQVRKYIDRLNRHKPRTSREESIYHHHIIEMDMPGEDGADGHDQEAAQGHHVVLREKLPMIPLSIEEAIVHLEKSDDPFFAFTNSQSEQINVLYAREDGTYGLIEPQK